MTTKKERVNWKVLCTGLVCITAIELYALNQGMNGLILTTIVAIIAAAIGVVIPNPLKK